LYHSGLGALPGDYAPASIAVQVNGVRTPPIQDQAVVFEENSLIDACLSVGATALGEPWPPLQPVSTWC
jgi:hypothetical protein